MSARLPGGKTVVITGATSGIGRAVAFSLGATGARLALVGRNERAGRALERRIPSSSRGSCARFFRCDLSNFSDVRQLAAEIKQWSDRIDVLINNAGARFYHFEESSVGIERTFATNYLGHFLLTALLLDRLFDAPSSRILTVASSAHFGIDRSAPWLATPSTYDRKVAYSTSKLANVVFAYELARRLAGTTVTSNAIDPGGVATNLGRNNGLVPWLRHLIYYLLRGELLMPSRAASAISYLALSQEITGVTGQYFRGRNAVPSSAVSYDLEAANTLWALSLELTGVKAASVPAWEYIRPARPYHPSSSSESV